jgi:Tfp pilus assembly protein PilX
MKQRLLLLNNSQDGSVIVSALFILLILTIVGISATSTSTVEVQISTNDKLHKMAFYAADGGSEAGIELVEQNIEERGFGAGTTTWGATNIYTTDFYGNEEDLVTPENNIPTEANRDVEIPNLGGEDVHLKIYGNTQLSTGNALQLAAGYEGKGKSISGGGAAIVYDIRSFANGPRNGQARVLLRWRHLL